jgi:polyhydroxyalkanoate synthase
MDNRDFVENFIRMEKWIFDSPDITGETFRQFVKDCYQKNLLIKSQMEVGGQRVELKNITMPLLNFYGKFDHLVPPAACELLSQRVGSKDTEDICLDTGHIGIYVSSKCQRAFSPKIIEWLKARDQPAGRPRRAARSTARTAAASGGKRRSAAAAKTKKA